MPVSVDNPHGYNSRRETARHDGRPLGQRQNAIVFFVNCDTSHTIVMRGRFVDEIGLNCTSCGYNLTGLTREVCPECGTTFDLELLRNDPELRRVGTPVYGKRGVELIPRTLETLFLLLFRPRSFAQRLRFDEPLGPSVVVFVLALSPIISINLPGGTPFLWTLTRAWQPTAVFVAAMGILVLAVAVVFAASAVCGTSRFWAFPRRFRFWCIVAMYTTIFVPLWPLFCAGTRPLTLRNYATIWPFFYLHFRIQAYPATILLLWWTLIISVVLWYRNRPRWLAILLMLAAFLFVRASVQIVDGAIPRLSR